MKTFLIVLVALVCPSLVFAQTNVYQIGIFHASVSNANDPSAVPVLPPINYTIPSPQVTCGQPKIPRSTVLIVSPTTARIDDPLNPSTADCTIAITAQIAGLPNTSTQYRAAIKRGILNPAPAVDVFSDWSVISTNFFSRTAPPAIPVNLGIF